MLNGAGRSKAGDQEDLAVVSVVADTQRRASILATTDVMDEATIVRGATVEATGRIEANTVVGEADIAVATATVKVEARGAGIAGDMVTVRVVRGADTVVAGVVDSVVTVLNPREDGMAGLDFVEGDSRITDMEDHRRDPRGISRPMRPLARRAVDTEADRIMPLLVVQIPAEDTTTDDDMTTVANINEEVVITIEKGRGGVVIVESMMR
jgi:hypothetical protein